MSEAEVIEKGSSASLLEEPAQASSSAKEFVNDGPFRWMADYMGMYSEGKTVKYGVLTVDADTGSFDASEAAARRLASQETLTNIGTAERERRDQVGDVMIAASAIYATYSSLFMDDGGIMGHVARFGIILPVMFALGYKKSADSGL
jgi:hypothetical protein